VIWFSIGSLPVLQKLHVLRLFSSLESADLPSPHDQRLLLKALFKFGPMSGPPLMIARFPVNGGASFTVEAACSRHKRCRCAEQAAEKAKGKDLVVAITRVTV
jgi:hypothetical protein